MNNKFIQTILLVAIFIGFVVIYKTAIAEHNVDCSIAIDERSCTDNYRDYLKLYNWDIDLAYKVMYAESHIRSDAYNPERHRGCNGSVGLFQIACIHDDVEKLKDPEYNIKKAYEIYEKSGWYPWGVCHNGTVECGI